MWLLEHVCDVSRRRLCTVEVGKQYPLEKKSGSWFTGISLLINYQIKLTFREEPKKVASLSHENGKIKTIVIVMENTLSRGLMKFMLRKKVSNMCNNSTPFRNKVI